MDFPDPIGWQLQRKQRENKRKARRELLRQAQSRAALQHLGEGWAGEGSGLGVVRFLEKGLKGKGKEEGARASQVVPGGCGGPPHPNTLASPTAPRQCTHSSDPCSPPSGCPFLWSPCLRTHWPRATSHLGDPTQQPPDLIEKEHCLNKEGEAKRDGWLEGAPEGLLGDQKAQDPGEKGPWGDRDGRQLDATSHRLISGEPQLSGGL
ncbi:hypothetical protein P7K49_017257 [Saguinus oedipus]|uniref:Uncharacterized protein n=1 Tax=Saguinus oedipus TaxID=9490 RepID=A0ABQ9V2P0_SAGOE|nr:hypothetical protein P7K49_017257 [Saguinus oedipus]